MVPVGTAPSSSSDSPAAVGSAATEPVELRHRCSECIFQTPFRREFIMHYESEVSAFISISRKPPEIPIVS
jgi:hypothetical protein